MTPLFISYVCDYCDGLKLLEFRFRGYIVFNGNRDPNGHLDYVFPTRADAEQYRRATNRDQDEIREVYSEFEFKWHMGRGSIKNLKLADHIYTIYPDYRFEPGPYRACLIPPDGARAGQSSAA
jgi:hypothetical protein